MKFKNPSLSVNKFITILACYYTAVFNYPFFKVVKAGLEQQGDYNLLFVLTIPLFLIFALSFIFSFFSFKFITKPFFIVLTLASSLTFYSTLKYNIIFSTGMIQNIFQTNNSEALSYLNVSSMIYFIITGILPSVLIAKANITYKSFTKEMMYKFIFMVANVAGILIIAAFFLQNYMAFGRNNSILRKYIIPTYSVNSFVKYVNTTYFLPPLKFQQLGTDAKIVKQNTKPALMVLVVGETARAKNYEVYGYKKPTNQFTSKLGVISFSDFSSCGTATAVSLPCMFSRLNRANYNERKAYSQENLIDVIAHAAVNVFWIDNDSGCKGVCSRITNVTIPTNSNKKLCDGHFCYDEILLDKLDNTISRLNAKQDNFIVLHLIGSHGPTYYKRYPKDKKIFTPTCDRSDIQNCTNEELVNTYDNTIAYTDFIISKTINKLEKKSDLYDVKLIYLSDHGESLGEKGLYLHGAPYAFAPNEQTKIPFFFWKPTQANNSSDLDMDCVRQVSKVGGYSQDNLFDTVLGLMHISTTVYDANQDMFSKCKNK